MGCRWVINVFFMLGIFSVIFMLFGCDITDDKYKNMNTAETVSATAVEAMVDENMSIYCNLYKYELKKYEPAYGCYLGAYILEDKAVGYDMPSFEIRTAPHCSYKYYMKLNEEFPLSWVLSCYKDNKLPFIVIAADNNKSPYDYSRVSEIAEEFGKLNIPIIVGFYPDPESNGYNPSAYRDFYSYARNEFRDKAPNAAFAFIASADNVYSADRYFNYADVDWFGIDLYLRVKNGEIDNSNLSDIEFAYNRYQSKMPIMLSAFGVSGYTEEGHKYYTRAAAEEIENIYSLIGEKYKRIKAIYYMDYDCNSPISMDNEGGDSFLITNDDIMTEKYIQAINNSYFLSTMVDKEEVLPQRIRISAMGIRRGKRVYIPINVADNMGFNYDRNTEINNVKYIDLYDVLESNSISASIKENEILLSNS